MRFLPRLRTWSVGILVLAPIAITASAFACIPQPLLSVQPRASGTPGTKVTAEGTGFGSGTIEIRWNSTTGAELARTVGPNFSADLAIPAVADGLYVILAFSRTASGGIDSAVRAEFLVSSGVSAPSPTTADHDQRRPSIWPVALAVGGVGGAVAGGLLSVVFVRRPKAKIGDRP